MFGFFTGGAGFLPALGAVIAKEQFDIYYEHQVNLAAQWFYEKMGYQTKVYKTSFSNIEDYNVPKDLKQYFKDNKNRLVKEYNKYQENLNRKTYPWWQWALVPVGIIIYVLVII